MSILNSIGKFIVGALIATGIIASPVASVNTPVAQPQNLGASITQGGALYDGFLDSGIVSTASSMTLTSGSFKDGTSLSGWNCFTVDANSPSIEYICGTASGTVVSSLVRGVGLVNPNTTSTALAFYHGRGASVQITDYPDLQILKRILNGQDAVPNQIFYSTHPSSIASTTIEDKNYVDSQIIGGGVSALNTVPGISFTATTTQLQNSTAQGTYNSTNYYYSVNAGSVASTSRANSIPLTNASGTIDPSFIPTGLNLTTTSTAPYLSPVGEIVAYMSSTAPAGWLLANGQTVATATYPNLFALIGYTYGGSTSTFGLPNMGGRTIFGPSVNESTTLGATGGATSSAVSINVAQTTGTSIDCHNIGGCLSGTAYANQNTTNTIPILNPYIIEQYIIKY